MPQDLGRRHLLLNIPNFELDVVEEARPVLKTRAVVGRPYRRTPVYSDQITYPVLNPSWNVPPTIASQDFLPQLRKDSGYLATKGIRVFKGWGADATEVDPHSVN